jgi:hypothetical protein
MVIGPCDEHHGGAVGNLQFQLVPSVSLHTYTIESVASGEPGTYAVREKMSVGEAVRLELVG